MPKIVYVVMGVLVVAVVVLAGLVGYLYGKGSQTAIVTTTVTSQTTTAATTTKTQVVTVTTKYTTLQPSPYKIEATTETANGTLWVFIRLTAPPGDYSYISVYDSKGESVSCIIVPPVRAFLDNFIVSTNAVNLEHYKIEEEYCTFMLTARNGSIVYSTTIKLPMAVNEPSGNFTRFERLEITSAYAKGTNVIVLNVKNTGSVDATITDIFINGKPLSAVGGAAAPALPISMPSGSSTIITLTFTSGFPSGVTLDVKLHTASGTDYPKAVIIP